MGTPWSLACSGWVAMIGVRASILLATTLALSSGCGEAAEGATEAARSSRDRSGSPGRLAGDVLDRRAELVARAERFEESAPNSRTVVIERTKRSEARAGRGARAVATTGASSTSPYACARGLAAHRLTRDARPSAVTAIAAAARSDRANIFDRAIIDGAPAAGSAADAPRSADGAAARIATAVTSCRTRTARVCGIGRSRRVGEQATPLARCKQCCAERV